MTIKPCFTEQLKLQSKIKVKWLSSRVYTATRNIQEDYVYTANTINIYKCKEEQYLHTLMLY